MNEANWPLHLTVDWLRKRYAKGRLTPEEVVLRIVERARRDADMAIWITPPTLEAAQPYLARLGEMDQADYPLWGIPFAVKDNMDCAGMDTTAACEDYRYRPDAHAAVVQRLVDAGAIPIGKANLDQFATGLVGVRSPYGETHNALLPELISGGSSSGSAVAVARGQAVFALGTDTAGSGRIPAALNDLVGYKAGRGAWPVTGLVPACPSLDCISVFAHKLDDALLVDRTVRGEDGRDPWSRNVPDGPALEPRVVYVPAEPPIFFGPYAEQYEAAWQRALRRLRGMNVQVKEADMGFLEKAAAILYDGPWIAERWSVLGDFVEGHPGAVLPVTEGILRSGDKHSATALFQAIHQLQRYKRQIRDLLGEAMLMLPTCGGTWTREQVRQDPVRTNSELGRYTNHCNLLDLCAVALPAGEAAPGVPFGVTLFAPSEREPAMRGAAQAWLREGSATPAGAESVSDVVTVGVCGLHMRGMPLECQMHEHGAEFVCEAETAPQYRIYRLPIEPAKPGLVRRLEDGASLQLELWEMPLKRFGSFVAAIPAPLGIGRIELLEGGSVLGFVCEAYAVDGSEDITDFGGWRAYLKAAGLSHTE